MIVHYSEMLKKSHDNLGPRERERERERERANGEGRKEERKERRINSRESGRRALVEKN